MTLDFEGSLEQSSLFNEFKVTWIYVCMNRTHTHMLQLSYEPAY